MEALKKKTELSKLKEKYSDFYLIKENNQGFMDVPHVFYEIKIQETVQ